MKLTPASLALIAAVLSAPASAADYVIDTDKAHASINFRIKHLGFSWLTGRFDTFKGTFSFDEANPSASKVDLSIDVASIETGSADRDGHLKSGDFFDAETYPTITFTSTKVERDGDDWNITGDLTIKDVTKSVTIPFEQTGSARDPFGNVRVGFEGETTINRKDWGLTWNAALETGGVLVSEKVKLEFDISAIAASDES